MAITEELAQLQADTLAAIAAASTTAELEAIRVAVIGKSGTLTAYLRSMGSVPKEERASVGKAVNAARVAVEEALAHLDLRKLSDRVYRDLESRLRSEKARRGQW